METPGRRTVAGETARTMHKLHGLRVERALTQAALAREAGLDTATVNRLEQGRRPASLTTVRKLARAFGVEPKVLLDCGPVEAEAAAGAG